MKKINLIILLFLIAVSCIKDYSTITEYKIRNLTNTKITLYVSNFEERNFKTIDTTILILPKSSIDYYYSNKGEDSPFLFPFGIESDTVIIFFNDSISKTYLKNDSKNRNPLSIQNYSGGKKSSVYYLYEYSITEDDFETSW